MKQINKICQSTSYEYYLQNGYITFSADAMMFGRRFLRKIIVLTLFLVFFTFQLMFVWKITIATYISMFWNNKKLFSPNYRYSKLKIVAIKLKKKCHDQEKQIKELQQNSTKVLNLVELFEYTEIPVTSFFQSLIKKFLISKYLSILSMLCFTSQKQFHNLMKNWKKCRK